MELDINDDSTNEYEDIPIGYDENLTVVNDDDEAYYKQELRFYLSDSEDFDKL